MLAVFLVATVIVLGAIVVRALYVLARARERDELADAEVVRRLRPKGNATKIERK